MNFKNFKIPAEAVSAQLQAMAAGFAASGKAGTFEENALRVIGQRVTATPACYLEFGPYWPAVKQALNAAGFDFGAEGNPAIAAEYRGATVAETLVAAELFKEMYRGTYFAGHSKFDLADDGEVVDLRDPDMQAMAG